ncbi:hypothetical protein ACXJJ3_32740 [Kribbella sp. WER1]
MSPAPESDSGLGSDGAEIRVMLARFEAKLDVALAQHSAKLDQHDRELRDLRELRKEAVTKLEAEDEKLAARVTALEQRPSVAPKALWGAFVSAVGVIAALSPLLARLYGQ